MRGQRQLSQFDQLRKAIDSELFDITYRTAQQMSEGQKIDFSFVLGYREALRLIACRADAIYNRGLRGEAAVEYLTGDEMQLSLMELIEKEV